MLRLALRSGDAREVVGQLFRLALAPLGSALGRFPAGNTSRARVSAFAPMPLSADARRIFAQLGLEVEGTTLRGRAIRGEGVTGSDAG